MVRTSVPDQDPRKSFGPPGSGSVSQTYGAGKGSFHHQTKTVRETLFFSLFSDFFMTFS
jgi:hypothetical protein